MQSQPNLDYAELLREAHELAPIEGRPALRIALLGESAVQQMTPILRALFHRAGLAVEFYEGAFDGAEFDTLHPTSSLYLFEPAVVILLDAVQGLRDKLYLSRLPWHSIDVRGSPHA